MRGTARSPRSRCSTPSGHDISRRSRSATAQTHGASPPTGRTLFVVDPRAVDGVPKILGNRLHVLVVKENGRLSENDADRQHLPVEDGAAPLGIAVVPA
jgi:hypothetical protein